MAAVSLQGITKSFGDVDVLRGINLEVEDGEFLVLVGPSGCGKSTLLRIIAGLEDASAGDLLIGEKLVNALPPKDRNIAMVFQNYALYPHMTVADNMSFGLRLRNMPKTEIEKKVSAAADILGLRELLDRYPKQLSGGQRQRVAMGRSIVRDPQVFLFDEPLSNLDAKLRVEMRTEIGALHTRLNTTTVYVTHDQVEAMTMADRIVILRDGNVEQEGSPATLYDSPANVFVASFIGSPAINLLSGIAQSSAGQLDFSGEGSIALCMPGLREAQAGQRLTLGIRPQHLQIGEAGFDCVVNLVESTGSETFVYANHGAQKLVAKCNERLVIRAGDRIRMSARPADIHCFDHATGVRIS